MNQPNESGPNLPPLSAPDITRSEPPLPMDNKRHTPAQAEHPITAPAAHQPSTVGDRVMS